MSSTQSSYQDQDHSSGFEDIDSNCSEEFTKFQSQKRPNNAASIDVFIESTYPSASQQSAIETLQGFENRKILELLSAIRLPGNLHYQYPEGLAGDHVYALAHLRSSSDDLILEWLRLSRGCEKLPYLRFLRDGSNT